MEIGPGLTQDPCRSGNYGWVMRKAVTGLGMRLVQGAAVWRACISRPMLLGVRAIVVDRSERVFLVRHSYVYGWHHLSMICFCNKQCPRHSHNLRFSYGTMMLLRLDVCALK